MNGGKNDIGRKVATNVPDRWSHISKGSIIRISLGERGAVGMAVRGQGPAYEDNLV